MVLKSYRSLVTRRRDEVDSGATSLAGPFWVPGTTIVTDVCLATAE